MLSNRGPIGIDVTARTIHAVQTMTTPGRPCITAAVSLPRVGDGGSLTAAEARELAAVLDRKQFKGRRVVAAVPARDIMMDRFRVPAGTSVADAAGDTLARAHRCPTDAFEHASWSVPGADASPCAMAVGCRHEAAELQLDALEAARFRVVALDAMPLALVRACRSVLDVDSDGAVIAHLDWNAVGLSFVRDGVVTFQRTLPELGLEQVVASMEEAFDGDRDVVMHVVREVGIEDPPADSAMRSEMLTDARRILIAHIERIGDELRRSLDYVRQEFDDASVSRVLTVGEGARLPGLDACLGDLAGVDVHVVNAGDVAATPLDAAPTCATPLLCPALGLALYPRRSS